LWEPSAGYGTRLVTRSAAEALKSERVLFTTRTPPSYGLDVDDDTALATFVSRIEQIGMTEVSEWQADVVQAANPRASGK